MHELDGTMRESRPRSSSSIACEDCGALRAGGDSGWVRVWLDEKYQPPVMLTYCPPCSQQFAAYPDEVSPIWDR
jgi:hypothetical protein